MRPHCGTSHGIPGHLPVPDHADPAPGEQGSRGAQHEEHLAANTFIIKIFSSLPKFISNKLIDKITESGKGTYSI
jgi:hypothetical protein